MAKKKAVTTETVTTETVTTETVTTETAAPATPAAKTVAPAATKPAAPKPAVAVKTDADIYREKNSNPAFDDDYREVNHDKNAEDYAARNGQR